MADGHAPDWRVGDSRFSEDVGEVITARVAAGESLISICRAADMPCRNTVRAWTHAHPAFGAGLMAAMRASRLEARGRDRVRWAAHEAARHWRGRGSTYRPELGEMICERLSEGESLKSIARDERLPTYATVFRWLSRHAEFAEMYEQARVVQAHYYFDEAREVALEATAGTVWVARLRFDIIRWQTARLAPKKYCERLMVDAGIAARKAQVDPDAGGLTVVIRRFTDAPDPEAGEYPEID